MIRPTQFTEPAAAAAATATAAKPSEPEAAPAIPSVPVTVPKPIPTPEQVVASAALPAKLPEVAAPPATGAVAPVAASKPTLPSADKVPAAPAGMATGTPPGINAQHVVSTVDLVRQMSSLVHDMHDENLRYRTEVLTQTGAVQAKASALEQRLQLAETRSLSGADAGAQWGAPPASDLAGDGDDGRGAVAEAARALRGYRVQTGSAGVAVLSNVNAGPERAARLLVMVGDQVPGVGRVTAITQRGRSWVVRTEHGVIQ